MADFDSIGFQVATHNDDEHVTFYDILDTYTQTASEEEIDLDQIHTVNYVLSYKRNLWLTILFYFLCFATLGILPLICHWYPFVMLYMTHLKSDKSNATAVLLESTMSKQKSVEYVREVDMMIPDSYTRVRVFKYRHACFIYDPRKNDFVRVTFNFAKSFSEITQTLSSGINATTRIIRKTLFGSNGVNIEVKNPIALLLDEVLHPFYIFQLFSVILWCFEEYWIYAMVIFFSSTISALVSLIETRRNLINLRNMAKHSCEIIRYSPVPERVDSDAIVPGDVIELENDMLLPCDVILLSGECIVNESMLTGESIPVVKSPIPKEGGNEIYSLNKHKNMTLFAGTKIVQVKRRGDEKVNGVCVKTGFDTAKGKLILSILFPRPTDFKYYRDSFRFIGILSLIALVGMVYTIIKYIKLKYGVKDIILRTGDLVTIVVPPALPVAITVGAALAIRRLKQVKIFCISPPRVNVAGVINCMCFDKTGTLTEDGLDLNALQVANSGVFATTIEAENITSFINSSIKETETTNSYLAYALATCHSLALVENKMIGDPLEQAIFSTLNFQIVDPQEHHDLETLSVIKTCTANQTTTHQYNSEFSDSFTPNMNSEEELYIMKRFEFSSDLKRMSVIVRDSSRREYSFVKGSPEHLRSLCDPSSVPHNFDQILFNYTFNGDRVLACGYKPINYYPAISREEADCNIIFLGLIIMQNRMKPESPVTIKQLHDAKIQNIMVTGDNSLTAVFIAKQSGIIEPGHRIYIGDIVNNEVQWKDVELDSYLDPISLKPFTRTVDHRYDLAITGNAFEALYADFNKRDPTHDFEGDPPLFHKLLVMCKVYARMSPEQKRVVSEELQKIDYFVGFCGDGANDTASLKASHIGISLSQAEASIAAPFTSMVANISCVPKVIREGRAALATTFQLFKYMALYSLIQFFTVVLLYSYYSTLGNYQFLFVDLLIIIPTSFLLSKTAASDHLGDERPSSSLLNPIVFLSVTVQMIIPALTMIISLVRLHRQEWYRATFSGDGTDAIQGMENTTLFYLSTVHTYFLAYAYSISKPFKKPLYTNKLFCSVLVILLALQIYVVLLPDVRFTAYWLELDIHIPMKWRVEILIYCAVHFVLSFLFEYIVIAGPGKKIVDAVFKGKFSLLVRKVQNMRAKQTQAEKLGHSGKKYNHIKLKLMQNHTAFSDDVASPTEENLANTV